MTHPRQHMMAALQLSGKGERTQDSSVRKVRLLAQCYPKSPDLISEQELQAYFLHRQNVDGRAPAALRLCSSGLRFFSPHVLQRDWHTLSLLRPHTTHRLPAVLSVEEVRRLHASATPLHNQVSCTTVSSLGLRLHAALSLPVSAIDGQRLQVEALRPCLRAPQRLADHALFHASAAALTRLATDERFLGTHRPGFTGVLHPWGRQLQYHPHIHSMVPGGGLAKDRTTGLPSRANCFVPVKALAPLYRAIFQEDMRPAGRLEHIAPQVWTIPWHVPSQAKHHAPSACTCLAPYGFKGASSNRRIVSRTDRTVTFTDRNVGRARPRTAPLAVMEFLRRFLQHVVPDGCMKVRHCGFLPASCAVPLATIRLMSMQGPPSDGQPPPRPPPPPRAARCPTCGAPMRLGMRLWTSPQDFVETS